MFGSAAPDIIARASLRSGSDFDLANAVFAEIDGEVVGLCSGSSDIPQDTLSISISEARWRSLRALTVFIVAYPVISALLRRVPGEWYLQAIAVDASVRSSGVGSVLFSDAVARARASGAQRLVLDVEARNNRARALYERLGMTVQWSSRKVPLVGQVHRMGMAL
jgi:ribosomal protein S18 acetylase RimI-like enzyme